MPKLSIALMLLMTACLPGPPDDPPEPFSDCRTDDGDPIEVGHPDGTGDAVWIEEDTLHVIVSHGGGCEEHVYEICWPDQAFMESEPVQVALEIWHDANDDMCDAYLTEELAFDLTPLRDAWHDSYGAGPGIITIHVDGESVEYAFDD